eukprot:8859409-Alexandrium_andersonii.AAC.1
MVWTVMMMMVVMATMMMLAMMMLMMTMMMMAVVLAVRTCEGRGSSGVLGRSCGEVCGTV